MNTIREKEGRTEGKLIVALDYDNEKEACALMRRLGDSVDIYKVGLEIFLRSKGSIVEKLHAQNKKVFLDLKFHDITNTVLQACSYAAEQNVFMFNLHCANGEQTLRAVSQMLRKIDSKSLCIGVTVLTNLCDDDLRSMYGRSVRTAETVEKTATLAHSAGLHGIVCSAHEAAAVKRKFGNDFITVCPGIRPSFVHSGGFTAERREDQSRIMNPYKAVQAGADYLVIGRPVTQSGDPVKTVCGILDEITAACGNSTDEVRRCLY